MQSSIREIRTRLLLLLLRAFVIVLSLSFLFFIMVVGYFLTSAPHPFHGQVFAETSPSPFHAQLANSLEGYYLGQGSWEGVETVFESSHALSSLSTILLDNDQRIILDHRPDSVTAVGSRYAFNQSDVILVLNIDGNPIGYLVITAYSLATRISFVRAILFPIGIISFILALFLVVVGILLVRRFVNPLAEVIYAARAVANGDLKTRIPTKGPQDLRSLSNNFNEMASSLERNDRERREMLADVAHELRTPLSVIRGRLEGIVDGIYSENGPQVSMALEQTYVLSRLVEDLRLLTLVETHQLAFEETNVDIGELIERVLNIFSAEAQEKNISLSFNEKKGNLFTYVDPQRFEQVLSNLLSNSLRYVPEGGKVWVTANETSNSLQIIVNDNGGGIPNEDLPYIFDRFWRKEKSRTRATGGTGLGLAIAKQLVEAQNGTIEARNLSEGGLQIIIEWRGSHNNSSKHI